MRLKYFLRGLGIGIVVTTIILAISHSANRKMSDSEVIERAKELGMGYTTAAQESSAGSTAGTSESETDSFTAETSETESITSSEPESTQEPESSEAVTTEIETTTKDPAGTRETTTQENTQRETTTHETTTEAPTTQAETTKTESESAETEATTATTYTLTITSGMSSNTVCDMLKRNGIIADSGDFDRFLVSNGYADRIRVGSFEVNSNMSYEELAAAFCSR